MVATHAEINYEALAETQPQLILATSNNHGYISQGDHLDEFGIKYVALDLRAPSRMRNDVRILGQIFQHEKDAQRIIDFYDKYQNLINERIANVPESERPTVFFEMHGGAFRTGIPGSQYYQQVELAGGRNIAKSLEGSSLASVPEVSAEWVAEYNPDYMLKESTAFGFTVTSDESISAIYDDIKKRPGMEGVTAIKEDNIIMISVSLLSSPGYIVGECYLAKELYPDLFQDLDPDAVLKEWFEIAYPGKKVEGIWTYKR